MGEFAHRDSPSSRGNVTGFSRPTLFPGVSKLRGEISVEFEEITLAIARTE